VCQSSSHSTEYVLVVAAAVPETKNMAGTPMNRAAADTAMVRMADMAKPFEAGSLDFRSAGTPLENDSTAACLLLTFVRFKNRYRPAIAIK
jgi:hypothetical protein